MTLTTISLVLIIAVEVRTMGQIIYAINAGGVEHVDVNGIRYQTDPLRGSNGLTGTENRQWGKVQIQNCPKEDLILYTTERYTNEYRFKYTVPIQEDGEYILAMLFREKDFNAKNKRKFNVLMNDEHKILWDFDIFAKVGSNASHIEFVPFTIQSGWLRYNGAPSMVQDNQISVEFCRGYASDPMLNAMYIMKGGINDVPLIVDNKQVFSEPVTCLQNGQSVQTHNVVVFAINAGGKAVTSLGFRFAMDPYHEQEDVVEELDVGENTTILNCSPDNRALFQTQRYTTEKCFGYEFPVDEDGDYVIGLGFTENVFEQEGKRMFNVYLEQRYAMFRDLDVYKKVGKFAAYWEYISFSKSNNVLSNNEHRIVLKSKVARINFCRGKSNLPILNTMFVLKGCLNNSQPSQNLPNGTIIYAINAGGKYERTESGVKFKEL